MNDNCNYHANEVLYRERMSASRISFIQDNGAGKNYIDDDDRDRIKGGTTAPVDLPIPCAG
jgi:hypothetical protein